MVKESPSGRILIENTKTL